jgi:hypothetical protein
MVQLLNILLLLAAVVAEVDNLVVAVLVDIEHQYLEKLQEVLELLLKLHYQ